MSGNGRLVAFASTSPELAPSGTRPPDAPFVVLADGDRAVRVVVEDGDRPTLSNDGHHIVYVEGADVRAQRWGSGDPFVDVVDELVVADVGDAVTPYSPRAAPAVSRHGRWVTVESANGAALSSDIRFHGAPHVWVVERGGAGPPAAVDLGSALPGGELRTTLAVVNDGSFGIPVAIVTATSPFRTTRTDCVGVLHPATSCTVDVAVTISGPGSVTGDVTLTGSGWSPATIVVPVGATGQVPPTTVPPTTVPPTTQPPSTRPPVIVPPTRPRPTLPRPTRPPTVPSRPGGGLPSSGSTPSPQPADTVRFEPAGLTFGPTVIGAGRATSTIVLLDPDGATGVVVDVRIESGGTDFTVAENPCTGSVVPAGGCPIEVLFAPVATGSITATLVAEFADGTIVRAQLTGTASPPPTLSVSPSVADPGQVVALSGAGFPVGRSVQVGWLDGRMRRSINVDADGSFREPLVVLPSSRSGPTEVTVLGQPDLFDDVTATLLVGRVQRSIAPSDVRRAVVGY